MKRITAEGEEIGGGIGNRAAYFLLEHIFDRLNDMNISTFFHQLSDLLQ